MSKIKRQNKEASGSAAKTNSCRFIFISGDSDFESLKVLEESIRRIKKEFLEEYSFLILDTVDGRVKNLIETNSAELSTLASGSVKISSSHSIENSESSKISFCIWLPLTLLNKPINFNEFSRSELPSVADDEFYLINWGDDQTNRIEGFIVSPQTSDNLLSQRVFSKKPEIAEYLRLLRQNHLFQKFHNFQHSSPFKQKSFRSYFTFNPATCLNRSVATNITDIFQKRQIPPLHSGGSGTALSRLLFFSIALLALFILPYISYNAGISGDEEKHYNQAVKVYNYFESDGKDTTSLKDEKYKLNYYGQSFDLFTYVIIKKLHIEKIYEARHVMNGAIGALAIICSGLLASLLLGNIAGIFTMLLLFFSPGFLGHAMNNPLDIPFAFGYIFTLLQLVRFLKRLPEINYGIAFLITLGIAFTISIRVGGLVLIPYIFMFSGLYLLFVKMPWKQFTKPWIMLAGKGILVLSGISVLAYFLSILFWPYALQHPLKNPFEAMKMMENITVALRVMFEGKIIWSDSLPAVYIPKSIILTIPVLVLTTFLVPLFFIRKNRNVFWIFFLLFVVIFPVAYIIYKESNVYGAWRHLLFIYPPMVVMAGIGLQSLFEISKNKFIRVGVLLIVAAALMNPVTHIFRNYPNQYIYFNEIAGGIKNAYKKYETDYYMVSLKPGTQWIKDNILKTAAADSAHPVRIASNAPSDIINYYFREDKNKVKLLYTRYYDRGLYDWDYAVFFCNYIDPYQITHNIWPPKNTIHTITVDGVKICAIVKRENKDDNKGFELLNNALKYRNKEQLDESIRLLENAIQIDKYNEITYLNLGQAYVMREEFDTARKRLNTLLTFYPNYEKALNLIGYTYLNEGEIKNDRVKIERAISIFNDIIRNNHKFASAYHNLGLAFLIKGDDNAAFTYFQKSIDNNASAKDSYFMMANILEKRGDAKQAKGIREFASRL